MLHKVFTVYDSKGEFYFKPFFARSRGEALRSINDLLSDKDSQFSLYPGDYTFFEIGQFDDSNASFQIYDALINLGTGLELKIARE